MFDGELDSRLVDYKECVVWEVVSLILEVPKEKAIDYLNAYCLSLVTNSPGGSAIYCLTTSHRQKEICVQTSKVTTVEGLNDFLNDDHTTILGVYKPDSSVTLTATAIFQKFASVYRKLNSNVASVAENYAKKKVIFQPLYCQLPDQVATVKVRLPPKYDVISKTSAPSEEKKLKTSNKSCSLLTGNVTKPAEPFITNRYLVVTEYTPAPVSKSSSNNYSFKTHEKNSTKTSASQKINHITNYFVRKS